MEELVPVKKNRVQRPPLVRNSRGRVQVLPSRFNDSVIDNWKKDSKTSLRDREVEVEEEVVPCKDRVIVAKACSNIKKRRNGEKGGYKQRRCSTLCWDDGFDVRFKSFGARKDSSFDGDRVELMMDSDDDIGELKENNGEKKDGLYGPQNFYAVDIVWAKAGKKEPFWPAVVIDPMKQAPELVLRSFIADVACVMFLGNVGDENQRDYAWVRHGMIFPFMDYVDRIQEQTELSNYSPSDFQMAVEEAFLADQGLIENLIDDINAAACATGYDEVSESNQYRGAGKYLLNQDLLVKKYTRSCEACGLALSYTMSKKTNGLILNGQFLCKTCARLTKSKHYCGICKKVWNHSDSGSWDLENTDYYCPMCRGKFDFELSNSEKSKTKAKSNRINGQLVHSNKVIVLCNGVKGIYFPSLHLVVCKCGYCGTEKQALSEWE